MCDLEFLITMDILLSSESISPLFLFLIVVSPQDLIYLLMLSPLYDLWLCFKYVTATLWMIKKHEVISFESVIKLNITEWY